MRKGSSSGPNLKFAKKKKSLKYIRYRYSCAMIIIFALFIGSGLVFSVVGKRPTVSEREKRTLTEFPAFSFKTFVNGEYEDGIITWYADTFPGRDKMIDAQSKLTTLYGFGNSSIHGNLGNADIIPDVPTKPSETEPPIIIAENTPAPTSPDSSSEPTMPSETEGSTLPSVPSTEVAANESSSVPSQSPEQTLPTGEEVTKDVADIPEGAFDEVIGSIYLVNDAGYGLFYFNRQAADTYVSAVNRTAELTPNSKVYTILVPTSTYIYLPDSKIQSFGASNEADAFAYIGGSMNSNVTYVPITNAELNHSSEYIYFRTDHHWTALGAYYAYQQFTAYKGIACHSLDSFQKMEFPGFLGSFYTNTNDETLKANPDTIVAYIPNSINRMTAYSLQDGELNWPIVNDVSKYNAYNKYSCFIAGDNPFSVIENPAITDGSSCVVIKESFGNAFVPFLVDHYQTVYVIDYRYYNPNNGYPESIPQFINSHNVQDVIFCNNADAISSLGSMQGLDNLIK